MAETSRNILSYPIFCRKDKKISKPCLCEKLSVKQKRKSLKNTFRDIIGLFSFLLKSIQENVLQNKKKLSKQREKNSSFLIVNMNISAANFLVASKLDSSHT